MRKHIGDDLERLKHAGRRTIKRHHRCPFFRNEMQRDKDDDIDDQQMFDYSGQWHHKATGSGVSGLESFEYFFTAEGDKGLAARGTSVWVFRGHQLLDEGLHLFSGHDFSTTSAEVGGKDKGNLF